MSPLWHLACRAPRRVQAPRFARVPELLLPRLGAGAPGEGRRPPPPPAPAQALGAPREVRRLREPRPKPWGLTRPLRSDGTRLSVFAADLSRVLASRGVEVCA